MGDFKIRFYICLCPGTFRQWLMPGNLTCDKYRQIAFFLLCLFHLNCVKYLNNWFKHAQSQTKVKISQRKVKNVFAFILKPAVYCTKFSMINHCNCLFWNEWEADSYSSATTNTKQSLEYLLWNICGLIVSLLLEL